MKKYDVYKKGELPESAKASIKKAAQLIEQDKSDFILFSEK